MTKPVIVNLEYIPSSLRYLFWIHVERFVPTKNKDFVFKRFLVDWVRYFVER